VPSRRLAVTSGTECSIQSRFAAVRMEQGLPCRSNDSPLGSALIVPRLQLIIGNMRRVKAGLRRHDEINELGRRRRKSRYLSGRLRNRHLIDSAACQIELAVGGSDHAANDPATRGHLGGGARRRLRNPLETELITYYMSMHWARWLCSGGHGSLAPKAWTECFH